MMLLLCMLFLYLFDDDNINEIDDAVASVCYTNRTQNYTLRRAIVGVDRHIGRRRRRFRCVVAESICISRIFHSTKLFSSVFTCDWHVNSKSFKKITHHTSSQCLHAYDRRYTNFGFFSLFFFTTAYSFDLGAETMSVQAQTHTRTRTYMWKERREREREARAGFVAVWRQEVNENKNKMINFGFTFQLISNTALTHTRRVRRKWLCGRDDEFFINFMCTQNILRFGFCFLFSAFD